MRLRQGSMRQRERHALAVACERGVRRESDGQAKGPDDTGNSGSCSANEINTAAPAPHECNRHYLEQRQGQCYIVFFVHFHVVHLTGRIARGALRVA